MESRQFFQSLVAGGATVTSTLNGKDLKHRRHEANTGLHHGPMLIPAYVAEIVREAPDLHRTDGRWSKSRTGNGHRSRHLVARYADGDTTWLFRCAIPASREMVGEVVRTAEGRYRVHCWSAARPRPEGGEYLDPREYMRPGEGASRYDGDAIGLPEVAAAMPPLPAPESHWSSDLDALMSDGADEDLPALSLPRRADA